MYIYKPENIMFFYLNDYFVLFSYLIFVKINN